MIADSLGEARDASEAVSVEYEELPVVTGAVDALKQVRRSFIRRLPAT